MKKIFEKICTDFQTTLVEFNGENDCVHILINYPPIVSISKLVNSLKEVSSRLLRKEFVELKKSYFKKGLWSPSYFTDSVEDASLSVLKQYIEQQKTST